MKNEFKEEEKKLLLKIARDSIEFYLKNKEIPKFEVPEKLKEKMAVFVTLKKDSNLRGCIGHLEPRYPLAEAVAKMAIAAAFEDTRFFPLSLEELKEIKIEISIISPLRKIKDPSKEIELGKHGVIIKKGFKGGVFLPEVAEEFNYNLEEFLSSLCVYKAGLPADAWRDPKTEIFIFTTKKLSE